MNKLISLILMTVMPALVMAHEGHAIEGFLSHTLHGFSSLEMGLAASSVAIWLLTHKRSENVKKAGLVVALGLCGLSFGI